MSLGHALDCLRGCFTGPEVRWRRCMSERVRVRARSHVCGGREPGGCMVRMHPHAGTHVRVQASFVRICASGPWVAWRMRQGAPHVLVGA